MTDRELAEILALTSELPGVEFKGPGPMSDKYLMAKISRAVLGMANRRDGGMVVIGVSDRNGILRPEGISPADITSWRSDDVAEKIATYADPSVSFEFSTVSHSGKHFVILKVKEFQEIPVLCKKDYATESEQVLKRGGCYVRGGHKPQTAPVATQEEMRTLIELATEKRLRTFLAQATSAGLAVSGTRPPTEKDLFDQQLGDLKW